MLFFRKGWSPSIFELCVVTMAYGTLGVVTMDRLKVYQDEAERVELKWTVAAMRNSVEARTAAMAILGKDQEIQAFIGENPVNFLDRIPRNYLGELHSPSTSELPAGFWFFDKSDKSLNYLLKNGNSLAKGQPNMLKYKIKFKGLPQKQVKSDGTPSSRSGLVLEQVE